MVEGDNTKYRSELLIEIISRKFQFDSLSELLPGDIYPPYLLVTIGLFIEYGILDIYNYFILDKTSFITEPNTLAVPAAGGLAVVGLRYVNNGYADAIKRIGIDADYTEIDTHIQTKFEGLVSLRFRTGVYLLGLLSWHLLLALGTGHAELIEIEGLGTVLYGQIVSYSLIIIPLLVDLSLFYIAIHVAVPRRLAQADFDLFFYDPRNLGGYAPIGQLLKLSYYIYTAALLLAFINVYAPSFFTAYISTSYSGPGPIVPIAFSAAWIVGVISIGYSMHRIHSIMKCKKDKNIRQLEEEIKSAVDSPHNIHPKNIKDREKYEEAQEALSQVQSTKTYPTTFTMWSQIFISVLLPQALNMVVSLA